MKNIKFIFAALMSVAALSCQKELPLQTTPEIDSEANKIPLVLKTGKETKTSLQSDGSIHWTKGDKLAVFDNSLMGDNNNEFTASYVNGSSAEFTGVVGSTTSYIWAVYPSELAISGNVGSFNIFSCDLRVKVPQTQTAKAGTFADAHNISVAKTGVITLGNVSNSSVTFKNVCSLLSFTLPEELPAKITKVTISSASAIAGEMKVDYGNDTPSCSMTNNQFAEIEMTGTFEAGQTYWFVLAPVTLDGISIAVEDVNGNVYRKSSLAQIQLSQGKYRNLGKLEFDKMGEIAVSAEHVFEESILSGTKLSVALPHSDITKINLTVTNKDNNAIVRSIANLNDVADGVAISNYNAADNCPYLPYGEYSLTGTYTTKSLGQITVEESFSITERPVDLNVTSVGAYTSYTKYLSSGATVANTCDGASIYIEQIGGISENIYNNGNYADCFKAKFNDSETQITASYHSEVGKNRFSMTKYDEYESVKLYFDGIESSSFSLSNCHVTGIPYTLNPSANDAANPWSIDGNVKWNDGEKVRLGYNVEGNWAKEKTTMEKTFYAPANLPVIISCNGTAQGGKFIVSYTTTFNLYVSGTKYYYVSSGKNSSSDINSGAISCELDSNTPKVKLENTNGTNNAYSKITQLSIVYRDPER